MEYTENGTGGAPQTGSADQENNEEKMLEEMLLLGPVEEKVVQTFWILWDVVFDANDHALGTMEFDWSDCIHALIMVDRPDASVVCSLRYIEVTDKAWKPGTSPRGLNIVYDNLEKGRTMVYELPADRFGQMVRVKKDEISLDTKFYIWPNRTFARGEGVRFLVCAKVKAEYFGAVSKHAARYSWEEKMSDNMNGTWTVTDTLPAGIYVDGPESDCEVIRHELDDRYGPYPYEVIDW